jgi:hypothetical protein
MSAYADKANYPKEERKTNLGNAPTLNNRATDRTLKVPPRLPGTVIVIHGVNDVGVSYGDVEAGLCEGLAQRLDHVGQIVPAGFRGFTEADRSKLEEDPDAVFFKRKVGADTYSPVVPFYWGFRETLKRKQDGTKQPHGQNLDRWGNRLDKDFTKEGGPFANATSTLVDMWNRGQGSTLGVPNKLMADPLRPVLEAPGRMYMILSAQRLAMMISMVRDYHRNDVVSLVAHSQGCMLSLLAQAFLLQWGVRPADTLVLTHPPYSLVDTTVSIGSHGGGEDALMKDLYSALNYNSDLVAPKHGQTLHARLQTLVNIVRGVDSKKHAAPEFQKLDAPSERGMVGAGWKASADRDNRGKVYLYFCPEDTTVGLSNVQGIGWQGVADYQEGQQLFASKETPKPFQPQVMQAVQVARRPFAELTQTPGFFQRVFTAKKRPDPKTGGPVLVGQAPHDHALLLKGESNLGHATQMSAVFNPINNMARGSLDRAQQDKAGAIEDRMGLRRINAEALAQPVAPDMYAGALPAGDKRVPKGDPVGAREDVDGIDAAIATTSAYGYQLIWQLVDDQKDGSFWQRMGHLMGNDGDLIDSPHAATYKHKVKESPYKSSYVLEHLNQAKPSTQSTAKIEKVYTCMSDSWSPSPTGKLLVQRQETPDEVRLRQQTSGWSGRSFHGAIFASKANHKNVTAYDLAIGQGEAVSDPEFNKYLCAVADWRVKKPAEREPVRRGVLEWKKFLEQFGKYYNAEPAWRKALIEGTCDYYTTGELPKCLPVLNPTGLPPAVVCESKGGQRVEGLTPAPLNTLNDGTKVAPNVASAGPNEDGGAQA